LISIYTGRRKRQRARVTPLRSSRQVKKVPNHRNDQKRQRQASVAAAGGSHLSALEKLFDGAKKRDVWCGVV
jgi:hypothetical protein